MPDVSVQWQQLTVLSRTLIQLLHLGHLQRSATLFTLHRGLPHVHPQLGPSKSRSRQISCTLRIAGFPEPSSTSQGCSTSSPAGLSWSFPPSDMQTCRPYSSTAPLSSLNPLHAPNGSTALTTVWQHSRNWCRTSMTVPSQGKSLRMSSFSGPLKCSPSDCKRRMCSQQVRPTALPSFL